MPMYSIHKHELAIYQERQRKGELLMHGMTVTPNGYRVNLTMTPRVADAMKLPPLWPRASRKNASSSLTGAGNSQLGDGRGNPSRMAEQPESESAMKRAASPISRAGIAKEATNRFSDTANHCPASDGQSDEKTCDRVPVSTAGSTPAPAITLPSPEPLLSPLVPPVGRATVEPVAAPVMLKCFDCGVEHPAGEECSICAPLVRAAAAARERRRAYHKWKLGEGTRPI